MSFSSTQNNYVFSEKRQIDGLKIPPRVNTAAALPAHDCLLSLNNKQRCPPERPSSEIVCRRAQTAFLNISTKSQKSSLAHNQEDRVFPSFVSGCATPLTPRSARQLERGQNNTALQRCGHHTSSVACGNCPTAHKKGKFETTSWVTFIS